MAEEGTSEDDLLPVAAFFEFDSSETTVLGEFQRWHMDLSQIEIYFPGTVNAAYLFPINHWKVDFRSEEAVDAAIQSPGIHEAVKRSDVWLWCAIQ